MANKSHLIIAHDPLNEGELQKALCEETIPDAVWTLRFVPGDFEIKKLSTFLFCSKCVRKLLESLPDLKQRIGQSEKVYIYGAHERISKVEVLEESA